MKISEEAEEWLRAALEGKALEYRRKDTGKWFVATDFFEDVIYMTRPDFEVRIKPDVIVVNGIEVPAPERVPPKVNTTYFFPVLSSAVLYAEDRWEENGHLEGNMDKRMLDRGLVFLAPEHAVAMAKALLAHKPG